MASYGVRITLTLPNAGDVQWDGPLGDVINAILDVVANRVGVDGLDINGTLDVQGHEISNILDARFTTGGDPGTANSIFINSSGELCVRDSSNRLVQVTSGGSVNVTGTGGFGGDYAAANPGGASFASATSTFTFTVSGGTVYATVEAGAYRIHNGSSTGYVGLAAPSTIGSTQYTLTMPVSLLSTGRRVMEVDSTGSIALTQFPLLSGTIAAGGTYQVTGNVQATQTGSFPVVLATRDTLYATPQTLVAPAAIWSCSSPSFVDNTVDPPAVTLSTSAKTSHCPVSVRVGDRIDGYTWYINKGTAAGKVVGQLSRADNAGTVTAVGGASTTSTSIAIQTLTSSSIDHTVLVNNQYYFSVTGCGTTGDKVMFATFQVVRPTGSV